MNVYKFKGKISERLYDRVIEEVGISPSPDVKEGSIIKVVGYSDINGGVYSSIRKQLGRNFEVSDVMIRSWNRKDTSAFDVIVEPDTFELNKLSWELGHWELVKY